MPDKADKKKNKPKSGKLKKFSNSGKKQRGRSKRQSITKHKRMTLKSIDNESKLQVASAPGSDNGKSESGGINSPAIQETASVWNSSPFSSLRPLSVIGSGGEGAIWGIAVHSQREEIFVRSSSKIAPPVCVYNFDGKLLRTLGEGVKDLGEGCSHEIAIDTKRDLLLLPMHSTGDFYAMNVEGEVKGHYYVTDRKEKLKISLHGVTYNCEEDLYILCSGDTNKVYIISAINGKTVNTFSTQKKKKKSRKKRKHSAVGPKPMIHHINMGIIQGDKRREQMIIISEHSGGFLYIVNSAGKRQDSFGGGKPGVVGHQLELASPAGSCVDPSGRIIVCDSDNHRLVTLWREGGELKWKTLLTAQELGIKGAPTSVDCDYKSRKLFVGSQCGEFMILKCQ